MSRFRDCIRGRNKLKGQANCSVGALVREREDEWTGLMRAGISGDNVAYQRLLKAVTPVLRAAARRGLARAGQPVDLSEDIVQDYFAGGSLEATDLGRQCAVRAMAVCDRPQQADRRAASEGTGGFSSISTISRKRFRANLQPRPFRQVRLRLSFSRCRSVSARCCSRSRVDSASIKDTATKFAMSEGAVRVALHRALANLTAKLREQ